MVSISSWTKPYSECFVYLDVLEQFTPTRPKPAVDSKKASTSATPQLPATAPKTSSATSVKPPIGIDDLDIGDDFARELAEGMASLMREIAAESGTTSDKGNEKDAPQSEEDLKREEEFRKAWEAMLVEGLNGQMEADAYGGASEGKSKEGEAVKEDEFQASIRKAMEKLKESEANLHVRIQSNILWVLFSRFKCSVRIRIWSRPSRGSIVSTW